jgi:hypothetical protein
MILAIIYWRSQPCAALLTLIALLILVISETFSTFYSSWLPFALHSRGLPFSQIGPVVALITLVRSLLNGIAFALLLAAVISGRKAN